MIYSVEQVSPYDSVMQPVWQAANGESVKLFGSELLLLEALVKPIKVGDEALEKRYRDLLTSSKEVQLQPISLTILERAIQIRADFGLKTPDAIHAATAVEYSCTLLITNDPIFRRVPDIDVIVLDDYVHAD